MQQQPTPEINLPRLCRTLPIHELNARRARRQLLTRLPAVPAPPPARTLAATPTRTPLWVPGWGMPYE